VYTVGRLRSVLGIKRAISSQSGIGLPIATIVVRIICCGLGLFAILAGEMVTKGPIV